MNTDLVIRNARIYTQWQPMPWVEAIAVWRGRVMALGNDADALSWIGNGTKVIDLHGALVLPGFADAHIHFYDLALRRSQVSLQQVSSLENLLSTLHSYAVDLPPGAWLLGYGWDESRWPEPRFPTRYDLDSAVGDRPALIWRADLHAAVADSAALSAAGIGPGTRDPESGVIDRDERGVPTGVLREAAITLVKKAVPPHDGTKMASNLRAVASELHELGIVSVHDQRLGDTVSEGAEALRLYTDLSKSGKLLMRVSCNFEPARLDDLIGAGIRSGFGDEWVRVGHVKLFADGSLGAHTAWMMEPYDDDPGDYGVSVSSPEELAETIREAHQHGISASVHAIGDRAVREVLDIFETVFESGSPRPPSAPHRIEHVMAVQPEDIPRLGKLGIVASIQPIHCVDDMVKVERLWGKRGANTYRFKSLKEAGAVLASGSDAPVADPDPLLGIHAAVTRQDKDGYPHGGWYPDERLTVAEAVGSYTLGPAFAVGEANHRGRLTPGYLADFVALDRNIFTIPPQEIADARVTMTVIGGEVVFRDGV